MIIIREILPVNCEKVVCITGEQLLGMGIPSPPYRPRCDEGQGVMRAHSGLQEQHHC